MFLARDKNTGLCKGFAYVHFKSRRDAATAIELLNGHGYDHLILNVEWSKPQNPHQSNDFAIVFPIVTALYSKIHPEYASYIYLLAPISLAFLNPIGYVLCEISNIKANAAAEDEPVESADGRWPSIPPCSQMADSAYSTLKLIIVKIIESVFFNQELLITVLGVIGGCIFENVFLRDLQEFAERFSNGH
ncbi:hypothetical protein pipiens_004697 [Culex pipiens pipiens]|uniref:RRM domain-containing protein n=1 Tax=Culex pipiens pipiens TaxID=38569 RepID=A0ABD1CG64_CULPP